MHLVFFDDETLRTQLLPLTYTRPISELRVGIMTISEKWNKHLKSESHSYLTADYLQTKFSYQKSDCQYFINSSFCPNTKLIEAISNLELNESLVKDEQIIAFKGSLDQFKSESQNTISITFDVRQISRPWQIFQHNGEQIEVDFEVLTKDRISAKLSETNQVIGNQQLFIEEGAKVECAILNTSSGPIYIGKDAEVMEGFLLQFYEKVAEPPREILISTDLENILDLILKNGDDARVGSTICGFIQGVMFTEGLAKEALEDPYFVDRKLYPNVDFYSGIIYRAMGIPTDMFTVMFALGRLPGWIAQWREMRLRKEPIGRPRQLYIGETHRAFKPMNKR